MSGSIGLGGLVLSLFNNGSSSSSAAGLLSTLYGASGSSAASANPIGALRTAETNSTKDIALTAKQPAVAAISRPSRRPWPRPPRPSSS